MLIPIFSLSLKNKILFLILLICCFIGIGQTITHSVPLIQKNLQHPYSFLGSKFFGLQQALKGETHIGYWSDLDPESVHYKALTAQTQYALAPIILDKNNLSHRYIIIDAQNDQNAMNKIKELNIIPIKNNHTGLVLAIRLQK